MNNIPFLGPILAIINKQLDGWKTTIGLIGAVATFVLLVTNQLSDGFQKEDIQNIMAGFSALMIAVGLGHKAAKIETALKK